MGDKIRPAQMEIATVVDVTATNLNVPDTLGVWNALQIRRVTGTPNYVIPQTAADDFGATGARITKGWFTDLDIADGLTVGSITINVGTPFITTTSGDLELDSFTGTVNMPEIVCNGLQFTLGSRIEEVVTSISGSSTDVQSPSALAVWNALQGENLWDKATAGTHDYLKPHTTGDNLHLNDEESTLFTNSDLQIFRNGVANTSVWAASATASIDPNLNLIRSRGTIGTPTTVADNDLIGNINMIGYDGTAFRNGVEIHGEINGAVSNGVLPCDLVFLVNAGASVATEGMRLLKTKDLTVVGDVSAASVTVDNLLLNGNTLSSTSGNLNLTPVAGSDAIIDGHWGFDGATLTGLTDNITAITAYAGKGITLTGGDNADILLNAGLNGYVKIDNVRIYSSTVETTAGDLALKPVAGASAIIDSHWGFDGNVLTSLTDNDTAINAYAGKAVVIDGHWDFDGSVLTALTDSNTTITAYAGRNITIEGMSFDGVTLTMSNSSDDYIINCTRSGSPGAGKDFILNAADAVFGGGSPFNGGNIIFNTGAEVSGGTNGVLKVDADTDTTLELGRAKLGSPVTDIMYLSHYDTHNSTDYAIKQLSSGRTCVNSKAGTQTDLCVNNVGQLTVDATKTTLTNYLNQQGIFAEIYVADASAAQSIATGVGYTKSIAFTTNGQSSNATADSANDKITITQIGRYRVSGSCSATAGKANLTWRGAAFLNNVEQSQVHWKRKMTTTTDSGDMSFTGFIDVTSVPWDLDFRLRHDDGANQNFTIEYANLNAEYVGAT